MFEEEILYSEEQGHVGLYYDTYLGWVVTVELSIWSPSEYKRYLLIWGKILENLKSRGLKEVFGLCRDEKKQKFTELFGFVFTGYIATCVDGVNKKLMRLEL